MKQQPLPVRIFWVLLEITALIGGSVLLIQNIHILNDEFVLFRNQRTLILFFVLLVAINLTARLVKWWHQRRGYSRKRGAKNFVFGVENIRKLLLIALVIFTFNTACCRKLSRFASGSSARRCVRCFRTSLRTSCRRPLRRNGLS